MALQKQVVPIKFKNGVDTKTDKKQVVKLTSLQNGVFTTAESIGKRYGYQALPTSIMGGGNISKGVTIDAFNNQLVETDGLFVYGLNLSGASGNVWNGGEGVAGDFIPLDVRSSNVATTINPSSGVDCASLEGYQCFTWSTIDASGNFSRGFYSIIDGQTGDVIVNAGSLPDQPIRVITFPAANIFIIFTLAAAPGVTIQYRTISINAPKNISGAITLGAGTALDAFASPNGNRLYVAFANGTDIVLSYFDSAMTNHSVATIASAATALAVVADTSNLVWLFYNTTSVTTTIYNFSGGVVLAPTTSSPSVSGIVNITALVSGVIAYIFFDTANGLYQTSLNTSGTFLVGGTLTARGVVLTSKAFSQNALPLVIATVRGVASFLFSFVSILTDATGSTSPLARLAFEETANADFLTLLSGVNFINSSTCFFAYLNNTGQLNPSVGQAPAGVSAEFLNFVPSSIQRQVHANGLYLGGGMLTVWDGRVAAEYGFHTIPVISNVATSASGGSFANGFPYSISVLYEWFDAQGNHWRSAPSIAQTVTIAGSSGATGSLTFDVSTLTITAKQSQTSTVSSIGNQVQITIWITFAAEILHYLTQQFPNDPTGATISVTATPPILTPETPILYTDSGEVENIAPPAPALICTYRDRLMLIPAENRTSYWYSKEASPDFPAEFSDLFQQQITPDGGDITAIIQMDDKFVLFKSEAPYYITGEGPAANGTANDFTPEQIITSPVGTQNPASVVLTPQGVMFQASSGAGIWLLDRSLGVSYIGAEVEGFNAQTVTSAILIPNTTQVRFTLGNGIALVWDYYFQQWSVFTNIAAVAATVYGGVYTYLTAAGVVEEETPGSYTDNGALVAISLLTGWLPAAGSQGYLRVYKAAILGTYFSPHNLQVQVYYDFSASAAQTDTIVASSSLPYEYRILIGQQKCTALQFQITEQQASSFGQGLSLTHLALEVGVKGGIRRIGQSQTYG